jgi:hypothetical protein
MIDIDAYLEELERRVALQPDEPEPEGLAPGDVVTIDTADGETLYVVGSEDDARLLIATEPEIHRGMVWTKAEIRALVSVADDPEVLAEIRRLKRTIPGGLSAE